MIPSLRMLLKTSCSIRSEHWLEGIQLVWYLYKRVILQFCSSYPNLFWPARERMCFSVLCLNSNHCFCNLCLNHPHVLLSLCVLLSSSTRKINQITNVQQTIIQANFAPHTRKAGRVRNCDPFCRLVTWCCESDSARPRRKCPWRSWRPREQTWNTNCYWTLWRQTEEEHRIIWTCQLLSMKKKIKPEQWEWNTDHFTTF